MQQAANRRAEVQAEAEKLEYHKVFRADVLRIMYSKEDVEKLMAEETLDPDQYGQALEKAYPMFYLSVLFQKNTTDRVGDLFCT